MQERAVSTQYEQRSRVGLIGLAFLFFFVMVLGRLIERQVFEYWHFRTLAQKQHTASEVVPAQRGKIFVTERDDNSLFPLATNVTLYSLQVVPAQIKNPELVASKLMPFLTDIEESELVNKFKSKAKYLPPLKRKIGKAEAQQIRVLDLAGVYLPAEEYRYYPEETMAAHLLGFVNRNEEGQYGIESYLNKELGGQAGFLETEQDSAGTQIALGKHSEVNPENGLDIVLSLDRAIQYYVEKKLKESVDKHQATQGSVVIMDSKTGKIVAMAAYPTFNPNNYNQEEIEKFTNLNTSQVYEPGSVFKTITMAAGVDTGVISPSTTYTDTGEAKIADRTIKNSDEKAHGVQTMTQVLSESLNTGLVFVVQKLGKNAFYQYLEKFGFMGTTGIESAGEVKAHVKEYKGWMEIDLATMSFGQGIAVTPIQLVSAIGAIANDGKRMKPSLVDKILYPSGAVSIDPVVVNQPITAQTAKLVSAMMVDVVEHGHGKRAGVPGYWVAGKTGTAQIPDPKRGGYKERTTIGTFIGFAPVENPRFVMLTRIDEPKDVQFAESSAAPLFGDIAKFLLDYWHIPPTR